MSNDCFGNPNPGIPPSISDTFSDIQKYKAVPFDLRMEYHYARIDLMTGRTPKRDPFALLRRMNLMVLTKGG